MTRLNGNALRFALAGSAVFTVMNKNTGNRFTFKVDQPDGDAPHFVSVLTGPDNRTDFTYLGTIFDRDRYVHGRKSTIAHDAQSARVFEWMWSKLQAAELPECVTIHHEGRCGRCSRPLTVPSSIKTGLGPKCATY